MSVQLQRFCRTRGFFGIRPKLGSFTNELSKLYNSSKIKVGLLVSLWFIWFMFVPIRYKLISMLSASLFSVVEATFIWFYLRLDVHESITEKSKWQHSSWTTPEQWLANVLFLPVSVAIIDNLWWCLIKLKNSSL